MYHYTLFDDGEKKIARYQQYFAVKQTLQKISVIQGDGKRKGGVIWPTQGSGKSLTMVMLAQLTAMHPNIKNPKIINSFKKQDHPEIIIVVDKLLTGFAAPRDQVLYLTRQLKEHTLLQAIARVNRLHAKDYGYIIDYYGNLENL